MRRRCREPLQQNKRQEPTSCQTFLPKEGPICSRGLFPEKATWSRKRRVAKRGRRRSRPGSQGALRKQADTLIRRRGRGSRLGHTRSLKTCAFGILERKEVPKNVLKRRCRAGAVSLA